MGYEVKSPAYTKKFGLCWGSAKNVIIRTRMAYESLHANTLQSSRGFYEIILAQPLLLLIFAGGDGAWRQTMSKASEYYLSGGVSGRVSQFESSHRSAGGERSQGGIARSLKSCD